jgi:cation transport ATPase
MDTLVALGTGSAFAFSALTTIVSSLDIGLVQSATVHFEAASMITAFILLGGYLESKATFQASESIRGNLMSS